MANTPTSSPSFLDPVTSASNNTSVSQNGSGGVGGGGGNEFWSFSEIEPIRWNQYFPYQLLVVNKQKNGGYEIDSKWTFTMPFPPSSLQYQMPFGINVSATIGGIIEEHGGAPFRIINLSSTTGVLPLKGAAESLAKANFAEGIFAGTIKSGTSIVSAAVNTSNNLFGGSSQNIVATSDLSSGDIAKTTGYYQILLLQKFLEDYVEYKKSSKGSNARLAFAIWKEKAVYLVTPQSFQIDRNSGSPLEYPYSLSLKAYKRIDLNSPASTAIPAYQPVTRDANLFRKVLIAIQGAQRVLANFKGTLSALDSDITNTLFEPVRQTLLFTQDFLGVSLTVANLPASIALDLRASVLKNLDLASGVKSIANNFSININSTYDKVKKDYSTMSNFLQSQQGQQGQQNAETIGNAVQAQSSLDSATTSPVNEIFNNPVDHLDFFNTILLGQLSIPISTLNKISTERDKVRQLTRKDFEVFRDNIIKTMQDFCDFIGEGSTLFNTIFDRNVPNSNRVATSGDFDIMFALNQTIMALNQLAVSEEINQSQTNKFDFIAGLADRSGIAFQKPVSKFAVPFPYGHTLEQVSTIYLKDPDRWFELASLNGLKDPYVDEEGFTLPLLVNGRENEIVVGNKENLFLGQPIWLTSNTKSKNKRHILNIHETSPNNIVLTLDGDSDLNLFTTNDVATISAFLPNTINSSMVIFIPSQDPSSEDDFRFKEIPGVNFFDPINRIGGTDFLLDNNNDIVISDNGDLKLAIGLANIIQLAKLRLSIFRGSLNRHPDVGLSIKPGLSIADVKANDVLQSINQMFIDDPFNGVKFATVTIQGTAIIINMQIAIKSLNQLIPVTFKIGE